MSNIITELPINNEQIQRAKKLYEFHNIKNSFTKGESQIYGALGEILIMDYWGLDESNYLGQKDADFIMDGVKYEVKTKKTSVVPTDHYFNSVGVNSLHQMCDVYIFVRVDKNMARGWLCGMISKKDFMTNAFFALKGEDDPSSNCGFTFKESGMNLKIGECELIKKKEINKDFFKSKFSFVREENGVLFADNIKFLNDEVSVIYLPLRNKMVIQKSDGAIYKEGIVQDAKGFNNFFS